jgi:predicted regulator of Ras-like GTPase activity (Roadblock/LC7/MglB family)
MSTLPPSLSQQARRAAEMLLAEIDGANAIVVATADGFDLACVGARVVAPARIAAMVSSLAALGEVASGEVGIGAPRVLVVESSDGRLVVRCMRVQGHSLVVVVLTDRTVMLGLIWHRLAAAERLMNFA